MLQIDKAVLNTTRVSPGKLSLGDSSAGPVTQSLTISNQGTSTMTYDLATVPALSTGPNAFAPAFFAGFANVTFSQSSVTVPAGASATVSVTITANSALADDSLFGGYIVVSPRAGGEAIHVPYAGLAGNYEHIPVLTPTPNGFPWLAKLITDPKTGPSLANQPSGATYSLQNGDLPYFLLHLDHQARWMKMEVFDAKTGRAWHTAFYDSYLPRNSTSTGFFTLTWDGQTASGNHTYQVPNGQYIVTMSVLKALGDDSNPADVETWTSPVITLAKP